MATRIGAPPLAVWGVLANAGNYLAWNTTMIKIDGTIALDETIKVMVKDAPDRTFPLKVTTFEPGKRMVWEDGGPIFRGVRTYTLIPDSTGTVFVMSETFSGAMLGMIEGSLPDFTRSFETFATDLKKKAEAR